MASDPAGEGTGPGENVQCPELRDYTIDDRPENRQKIFVRYCMDQFDAAAIISRSAYYDPSSTKAQYSQLAGESIGAVLGGAVSLLVPVPMKSLGTLVAKMASSSIQMVGEIKEQSYMKKRQKKVCELLTGYHLHPDDPHWRTLLANAFARLFNNFSVQLTHLTETLCEDMTFEKMLWKIANDFVVRAFHWFEETKESELSESLLIQACMEGQSGGGLLTSFLNKVGAKKLGREIRISQNGSEVKFKTSEMIEKPDILFGSVVLVKKGKKSKQVSLPQKL